MTLLVKQPVELAVEIMEKKSANKKKWGARKIKSSNDLTYKRRSRLRDHNNKVETVLVELLGSGYNPIALLFL